jgi:hypothetical protein
MHISRTGHDGWTSYPDTIELEASIVRRHDKVGGTMDETTISQKFNT